MVGQQPPTQFGFDNLPPQAPETRFSALLRRIDELLDFEPVRRMAAPYFAQRGRPSLDPILMFKMMLVAFLWGITSDRRLVDECADRASVREFLGLGWGDKLPVHASFTHWRQRLGAAFFRDALHEIVRQCEAHGMELSEARTVDATTVKAQAHKRGPVLTVPADADVDEFLDECFEQDLDEAADGADGEVLGPVAAADADDDEGAAPAGGRSEDGKRGDDRTILINTHDRDARLQRKTHEVAQFRYNVSFWTDVATGLIVDAIATGFERASTALAHLWHDRWRVSELAADTLYDSGAVLEALQGMDVTCYVPAPRAPASRKLDRSEFVYDPERNVYICPEGALLAQSRHDQQRGQRFYTARVSDCTGCPRKAQCTEAKRRSISRQDTEQARAATVRSGLRYRQLQRQRRIDEHLHMLAKRDHGLSRARALGVEAMCIQASLTAAAIDLKRLVRFTGRVAPLAACGAQRARVTVNGARVAATVAVLGALSGLRCRRRAHRRR
jgi:transposase